MRFVFSALEEAYPDRLVGTRITSTLFMEKLIRWPIPLIGVSYRFIM